MATVARDPNSSEGASSKTLQKPQAIAFDSFDNVYVAHTKNDCVIMFCSNSKNGSVLLENGPLDKPVGITICSSLINKMTHIFSLLLFVIINKIYDINSIYFRFIYFIG
jgi:hypothetical protein